MGVNDVFGEVLEQTASAVKQTGQAVASQLGVPVPPSDNSAAQDASNEDIVESLYGKSQGQSATAAQPAQPPVNAPNPTAKNPEELAKMEVVRKGLHDEYYQQLVNPQKPQEETVVDKIEREKQEEMVDLQQKELEKPPPLAVQNAQRKTEGNPGTTG